VETSPAAVLVVKGASVEDAFGVGVAAAVLLALLLAAEPGVAEGVPAPVGSGAEVALASAAVLSLASALVLGGKGVNAEALLPAKLLDVLASSGRVPDGVTGSVAVELAAVLVKVGGAKDADGVVVAAAVVVFGAALVAVGVLGPHLWAASNVSARPSGTRGQASSR
jgi:hypothetical protein